jgi:hypothetical protein
VGGRILDVESRERELKDTKLGEEEQEVLRDQK